MSSIWTIRRSATDAKLTGLCGGVARHWGVDPVLIRLAAVLLALSGGVGLVLYLAGWLLIPVDGKQNAAIHDVLGEPARRWPREAWVVITAVCCIVVYTALNSVTPFGLGPAFVLALVWYFGYYRHRSSRPDRYTGALPAPEWTPAAPEQPVPLQFHRHPGPPTPFTEAAAAWRQRVEEAQQSATYRGIYDPAPAPGSTAYRSGETYPGATSYPASDPRVTSTGYPTTTAGRRIPDHDSEPSEDLREPVGPAALLPPARPLGAESSAYNAFLTVPDPAGLYAGPDTAGSTPVRPIRRSATLSARRLRLVALVAVGLTLSGLSLADSLGADVPTAAYFASCLLVLGLTLVAATWWGRARGILPVALLVLMGTLATTVAGPVAHSQGWASEQVRHTTVAQLAAGDQRELGHLQVDLTGLTTTANASYTAHVSTGALDVSTPQNANVVINWKVRSGVMLVNGQEVKAGSDQSGQVTPAATDPRKKTLTLNLSVDQGLIQVTR